MLAKEAVFLFTAACLIACGSCEISTSPVSNLLQLLHRGVTPSPTPVETNSAPCSKSDGQSNCQRLLTQWCQQLQWLQPSKTSKTYHVRTGRHATFFEAWRICRAAGQRLATINSPEEQAMLEQAIRNKTKSFGPYFIGGTDLGGEGKWIWMDSHRPVGFLNDYFNFHPNQPDNEGNKEHCLNIGQQDKFLWNDVPCTSRFYFICESIEEDAVH